MDNIIGDRYKIPDIIDVISLAASPPPTLSQYASIKVNGINNHHMDYKSDDTLKDNK